MKTKHLRLCLIQFSRKKCCIERKVKTRDVFHKTKSSLLRLPLSHYHLESQLEMSQELTQVRFVIRSMERCVSHFPATLQKKTRKESHFRSSVNKKRYDRVYTMHRRKFTYSLEPAKIFSSSYIQFIYCISEGCHFCRDSCCVSHLGLLLTSPLVGYDILIQVII